MAKGNNIIVSADPKGHFGEATVNGALAPGILVQVDVSAGIDASGRYTVEPYTPGANGGVGPIAVLCEASGLINGSLATTAYADGDRARIYFPIAGEELNVLSSAAITLGDYLTGVNATGKTATAVGTESNIPFQALEAATGADELIHVLVVASGSQV